MAARFTLRRPLAALGAGLIVERGQAAVLTLAGNRSITLQPGAYRFDGTLLKDLFALGPVGRMTLTFVVTADVELRFNFDDLLSSDHLPLRGTGRLLVRVARPAVFAERLLAGRSRATQRDLCEALASPMTDAMTEFCGRTSAFDLDSSLHTKARLGVVLEHNLREALDASGLEFVSVQAVQFAQEGVERERKQLGEVILAEREVGILERRIAAWEKLSDLAARLAAAEARNQQQLAEIRRSLEVRCQDQELIRRQLREKLEVQHQLELANLRAQSPLPLPEDARTPAASHAARRAARAYTQLAEPAHRAWAPRGSL